jgi:hypothetical protein
METEHLLTNEGGLLVSELTNGSKSRDAAVNYIKPGLFTLL